jgi:guanine nucleotide-binding protein alpha-1 subunit
MPITDSDPFADFLRPPPDESPPARAARERREAEAKRVSEQIDEDIRNEKSAMRKRRHQVTVLLLGQSESGKYRDHPPHQKENSH